MERTTCVVTGGGPAGMMMGLLLARAGAEVTVLEKHADFLRDFRGDTVHPSTLRLLDELGLGEEFARLDQSRLDEVAFPVGDGSLLVTGDFRRLRGRYRHIAMVPQWDLLSLLATAAQREPSFTLRMETEATGLIRDGDRVVGVHTRGADGSTGSLYADLTVACDGRWSTLRRDAGMPVRELPMPIDAWWFRLPRRDDETASALSPRMGPGRFGVVIPREGFFQIAYLGRKGTDDELRARGVEAFRRDVAELVPNLADRVSSIESMDDVKFLDARLNRLRQWHRDGFLCIGDAAHAMSPIGGVGINLAVQDAVAAATLLAEPLRRGRVAPRDLAAVRRRRLLPTLMVQRMQQILHHGIVEPVLAGNRGAPPRVVVRLLRRFPQLSVVPAYLIGFGLRPEHAPAFARRVTPSRPSFTLSRRVAELNKKGLNKITRRLFRRLPGTGVLVTRGRRSGRSHQTPVNSFRTADGYVFALTYGPDADWVRNVRAAGGATFVTGGRSVELTEPEVFRAPAGQTIRRPEAWFLDLVGVDQFLRMRVGAANGDGRAVTPVPTGTGS